MGPPLTLVLQITLPRISPSVPFSTFHFQIILLFPQIPFRNSCHSSFSRSSSTMIMTRLPILALLCFGLAALTQGATLPALDLNMVPEQYRDMIPQEVTNFYNELTEEDKKVLKEIAERHEEFQTEDQALDALKAKSEKLYNKAVELRNLVKGKIDALVPAAKEFVNGMIEKAKSLRPKAGEKPNLEELRKCANEIIEKYKALSEEAKESLKTNFPKITGVIQNEKFQALAQSLLKPAEAPAA